MPDKPPQLFEGLPEAPFPWVESALAVPRRRAELDVRAREVIVRAEENAALSEALSRDAVAALEGAGFPDLAADLRGGLERGKRLAERFADEPEFRACVERSPMEVLTREGLPHWAIAPLLRAVDAPSVTQAAVAADVEGHSQRPGQAASSWYHRSVEFRSLGTRDAVIAITE